MDIPSSDSPPSDSPLIIDVQAWLHTQNAPAAQKPPTPAAPPIVAAPRRPRPALPVVRARQRPTARPQPLALVAFLCIGVACGAAMLLYPPLVLGVVGLVLAFVWKLGV